MYYDTENNRTKAANVYKPSSSSAKSYYPKSRQWKGTEEGEQKIMDILTELEQLLRKRKLEEEET